MGQYLSYHCHPVHVIYQVFPKPNHTIAKPIIKFSSSFTTDHNDAPSLPHNNFYFTPIDESETSRITFDYRSVTTTRGYGPVEVGSARPVAKRPLTAYPL